MWKWVGLFIWVCPWAFGQVASFPTTNCLQSWANQPPTDYLYDFDKDAGGSSKSIDLFNTDGYQNYLARLRQNQLDRSTCHKTWTVLIYIAGTEDLLPYAYADLNEMEATSPSYEAPPGSSLRTDVLVQFDTGHDEKIRRLHMFPNGADPFKALTADDLKGLSERDIHSPVVSAETKIFPQTEKERFKNFLQWGIQAYPSEHYLVVIWGHGQGWTALESKPTAGSNPNVHHYGGVAVQSPTVFLDIPSLRKVLAELQKWTGEKVDVFASDACLMQSIENVTEIADHSQYICGSEGIQSFIGFPYGLLFSQLNSGKFTAARSQLSATQPNAGEPQLLAWTLPRIYQDAYAPGGPHHDLDPRASDTLMECSVSTQYLTTNLLTHINALGKSLLNYMKENPPRFMALKWIITNGSTFRDRLEDSGTRDIGLFLKDLADMLAKETTSRGNTSPGAAQLVQELPNLRDALNSVIVQAVVGDLYPRPDAHNAYGAQGLSIWLPRTDVDYFARIDDFKQSIFYRSTSTAQPGWGSFVSKMYPKKHWFGL
jgi:hypothetical protein